MIDVSVIIPIYNVEKYLDTCLKSVINQTLKNIEIICIEDASVDNSLAILENYQKKDKRIKTIIHKENKGQSYCRNEGLKLARGKYTYFLDSDDWIDRIALKQLFEIANERKTDILIFKSIQFHDKERYFFTQDYYEMKFLNDYCDKIFKADSMDSKNIFKMDVTAYTKLYNTTFLKNINAKFPENLIHEDNPFFYYTFIKAEKVSFINKYYYTRRHRSDSIMYTTNYTSIDIINICDIILETFIKENWYEKYNKALLNFCIRILINKYKQRDEKLKDDYLIAMKKFVTKIKYEYKLYDDIKELNNSYSKQFIELFDNKKNINLS